MRNAETSDTAKFIKILPTGQPINVTLLESTHTTVQVAGSISHTQLLGRCLRPQENHD